MENRRVYLWTCQFIYELKDRIQIFPLLIYYLLNTIQYKIRMYLVLPTLITQYIVKVFYVYILTLKVQYRTYTLHTLPPSRSKQDWFQINNFSYLFYYYEKIARFTECYTRCVVQFCDNSEYFCRIHIGPQMIDTEPFT